MVSSDSAVKWLLDSKDPSIRYFTLTEVLGTPEGHPDVQKTHKLIPRGPRVRSLLQGQQSDGGFGVHPYQKWTGAHWRLVSLVNLGIQPGHRASVKATHQVLGWLTGEGHRATVGRNIKGLMRRCASMEGNALGSCSRLGLGDDPRVKMLADSLVEWQWPDGGWNCDKRIEADHSSFYESLSPLWGLVEYYHSTKDKQYSKTIDRAAELFLTHNLFRSDKTGKVINDRWLSLRYPAYYYYDILQALRILGLAGKLSDPRVNEALDIVEKKRGPDGFWNAEGYYWHPLGSIKPTGTAKVGLRVDVVDWGRGGPNEFITLNALRVLKAAGRI